MSADPRLVEGVRLFNEREFYACHDVLEEVWGDTLGPDREFYQGLIHVAVCLFHFEGGNLSGARKMYESARRYLSRYGASHLGVDLDGLLAELRICLAELLAATNEYPAGVQLKPQRIPTIRFLPQVEP